MNFWILLQTILNLALIASVIGLWIKLNQPQKDDPRMSKGLQLLQNKISVIEDLSDRTDTQVKQLTSLLEAKVKEVASKIESSEKQIHRIDQATQKSLEVAQIFQDRIPHEEIMERQSTIKYVTAAQLAHKGLSVDEIAEQVDLSRGEIEFIAKVNRDQLMFCEEALPEWAQEGVKKATANSSLAADEFKFLDPELENPLQREVSVDIAKAFEMPQRDSEALKKLGEEFKKAVADKKMPQDFTELNSATKVFASAGSATSAPANKIVSPPVAVRNKSKNAEHSIFVQEGEVAVTSSGKPAVVKSVLFPKIDINNDLG